MEKGIRSIAFPSISTGIYAFPLDKAVKIAIGTAKKFVDEHPNDFDVIKWILFDDSTGLESITVNAGDCVGLLAEDTSEQIIEAFLQEKFETHYKEEIDRLNLWFLV